MAGWFPPPGLLWRSGVPSAGSRSFRSLPGQKPPLCKGRWHGVGRDGGIVGTWVRQPLSQPYGLPAPLTQGSLWAWRKPAPQPGTPRLPWAAGPMAGRFPRPGLPWKSGVPAAGSPASDDCQLKPPLCKGRWHGRSRDGGIVGTWVRQPLSQPYGLPAPLTQGSL